MVKLLNRYKGRSKSRAFTRTEVLVVIISVVILFFTFSFMAALSAAKASARQMACESNLKQIGIAFREWEADHDDLYPMRYYTNHPATSTFGQPTNAFYNFQAVSNQTTNPYFNFQIISNRLFDPRVLICPADKRTPAAHFADLGNNNLSYFVGLDAGEEKPALWLAGDRNLVTNGVDVVPCLVVIRTNDAVEWSRKMHRNVGNILMSDGSVELQRNLVPFGTNVNRLAVP